MECYKLTSIRRLGCQKKVKMIEEKTIKISVIIPVYNIQQYIEECIESVRRQTLKDLEILCVNDGSTDDSPVILHRMQETDDRIHIISQENQGAGKARNCAIQQAAGEFLLFLDGDDYLLDVTALEQMYYACIEHEVSICGAFRNCDRHGSVVPMNLHRKECEGYPAGRKMEYRDYQYDFHYSTYLYKRELLIKNQIFFPDYRRFQDPPFLVNAMIASEEFYIIPVELYCFRSGHQNYDFSHQKVNDIVRGLTDILKISAQNGLKELHLLEVSRLNEGYFWHIVQHLSAENTELLDLLMKANQAVQWQWIEELHGKNGTLLKALQFILHAGQEKCENYRKELEQRGYRNIALGSAFPFYRIPPHSKVVLYAAGVMGWTYYEQIKNNEDYELTGWVDRQYEKYEGRLPKINSVESIRGMVYDYVVIAIEEEKTALEIMDSLKRLGIPSNKIVWSLSYE